MSAAKVLWESEVTLDGARLRVVHTVHGGVCATLFRRTLMAGSEDGGASQTWFATAEVATYAPMPFQEALRLIAHFCDFYAPELKASLPELAKALTALPEKQAAQPPRDPATGPLN